MADRLEHLRNTHDDAIENISELSSVMHLLAEPEADYRGVRYHVVRLAEREWLGWREEFIATKTSPVELLGICAASWHMLTDLLRDSFLICVYESAVWGESQPELDLMSAAWLTSVDWGRSMPELRKNALSRFGQNSESECYRIQEWMRIEYVQTRLFLLGKDEAFGDGSPGRDEDLKRAKGLRRRGRPSNEGLYRRHAEYWVQHRDALRSEYPTMELYVAAQLTTGRGGKNPDVENVRERLRELDLLE